MATDQNWYRLLWVLFLALIPALLFANTDGIRIKVLDAETKNPISGCKVTFATKEGKDFSLFTSQKGEVFVSSQEISYLSFKHFSYKLLSIKGDEISGNYRTVYLTPKPNILGEVTVYSAFIPTNRGNTYSYSAVQAGSSISVIGEPDVLRHISSLPGVSQGIESTLGLFVRGGNSGSNGLYFNDVPLYVSSHLMGMVSVYPPDIINNANFHMGGIPAHKGNLSSSLLDVSIKKEYGRSFNGKLTLSPYFSGIYTSIPLIRDRMSLQAAARTSFTPFLINALSKPQNEVKISVYDITTSLNYRLSHNYLLEAFFFSTNDYFGTQFEHSSLAQNWRAVTGKIGWQADFDNGLSVHTWGYYNSTYSAQVSAEYKDDKTTLKSELGISSGLDEYAINTRAKYRFNNNMRVDFGASWQHQLFTPGNKKFVRNEGEREVVQELKNDLFALFCSANYTPFSRLNLQLGYRHMIQKSPNGVGSNFDFHVLSHIILNDKLGIELTFDRMTQFYHTMEGLPTGWSLNILAPSSEDMPTEITRQYYGGLFYKNDNKKFLINASLGGYYRIMDNIVTYVNGRNAFGLNSEAWKEETDLGIGRSYGVELSASVQTQRIGTTLAYTLSKTDRKFPSLNRGNPFPFKFDRRHILNLQSKFTVYKYLTKKGTGIEHNLNAVVAYSSGNRATLPVGYYEGVMPPYWSQLESGILFPGAFYNQIYDRQLMSGRNEFVMKDYFRIDVGYTLKRIGKKTVNEFSLSIFNVLNRHNPYIYFRDEGKWKQLSIVPIMPSLRWSISW